jgi:hypothetical protein
LATVNIGNLTFTHKGDYASGTAYVKNDVVYYSTNGNAYIAKQATTGNAPTNGTYWSQFAAGSGGIWNAGLSLGSAGQVVKVNSGASALEFGTVSSDFVKLYQLNQTSDVNSVSLDGYFTSDYRFYKIFAETKLGGTQSSDSQIQMRFNHGGSTFSGSNYNWVLNEAYRSGGSGVTHRYGRDDSSFSQFQGTWNLDDATHDNEYYEVTLYNPQNTTTGKMIKWLGSYAEGSNSIYVSTEGMGYLENTTACTGVTFLRANSNNLTGVFTLYGIKG